MFLVFSQVNGEILASGGSPRTALSASGSESDGPGEPFDFLPNQGQTPRSIWTGAFPVICWDSPGWKKPGKVWGFSALDDSHLVPTVCFHIWDHLLSDVVRIILYRTKGVNDFRGFCTVPAYGGEFGHMLSGCGPSAFRVNEGSYFAPPSGFGQSGGKMAIRAIRKLPGNPGGMTGRAHRSSPGPFSGPLAEGQEAESCGG